MLYLTFIFIARATAFLCLRFKRALTRCLFLGIILKLTNYMHSRCPNVTDVLNRLKSSLLVGFSFPPFLLDDSHNHLPAPWVIKKKKMARTRASVDKAEAEAKAEVEAKAEAEAGETVASF